MSYLSPPRLHFAGRFQAAPSTVNNDPGHFDNAKVAQQMAAGTFDGWWNPNGDAAWRLIDCRVTSAWLDHDARAAGDDPVAACTIRDSDRAPPAKIVDLDPEQQLVSEVWGLAVRIVAGDGTTLLRARYEPAAFVDIWTRAQSSDGGDMSAAAAYQSVLTDLEWGDVSASPFLQHLRQAAADGLLSIKFNVDGYNQNAGSPDFTRGRIVGTIGPWSAGEPRQMVLGRHLMAAPKAGPGFFRPVGSINFCTAIVDEAARKIVLDLGNALPTTVAGGALSDLGTLALGWYLGGRVPVVLDLVDPRYPRRGWYEATAGLVTLPQGRRFTPDELAAVGQAPLVLTATDIDGNTRVAIAEAPNGTYLRADRFVYRLDPGDKASVRLFASQWGKPYPGARIISVLDPLQLQAGERDPIVAQPAEAISFPARLVTGDDGTADLVIETADPGNPRGYIDGQVYGVRPLLEDDLAFGAGYNVNPADFVSLLVWSGFTEEQPPTWYGSIQPIFQQYANLYPVMRPIVDLADYESVCTGVRMLILAFALPIDDPNAMPVTRDLSTAKRNTILRWLRTPGADGKPLKGTPPAAAAAAATRLVAPAADRAAQPQRDDGPLRGGKELAMSRRLMLTRAHP